MTLADLMEGEMALIDGMLQELEQEAHTTRRVLERVPDDQLGWRPHENARTLGELALHIATVPGAVARARVAVAGAGAAVHRPERRRALRNWCRRSTRASPRRNRCSAGWTMRRSTATWRLMHGERELFAMPRGGDSAQRSC